jgi:hypothetical protein
MIPVPMHPNLPSISLALDWPQFIPFRTPCQVLCLLIFLFAPKSPISFLIRERKSPVNKNHHLACEKESTGQIRRLYDRIVSLLGIAKLRENDKGD